MKQLPQPLNYNNNQKNPITRLCGYDDKKKKIENNDKQERKK